MYKNILNNNNNNNISPLLPIPLLAYELLNGTYQDVNYLTSELCELYEKHNKLSVNNYNYNNNVNNNNVKQMILMKRKERNIDDEKKKKESMEDERLFQYKDDVILRSPESNLEDLSSPMRFETPSFKKKKRRRQLLVSLPTPEDFQDKVETLHKELLNAFITTSQSTPTTNKSNDNDEVLSKETDSNGTIDMYEQTEETSAIKCLLASVDDQLAKQFNKKINKLPKQLYQGETAIEERKARKRLLGPSREKLLATRNLHASIKYKQLKSKEKFHVNDIICVQNRQGLEEEARILKVDNLLERILIHYCDDKTSKHDEWLGNFFKNPRIVNIAKPFSITT